MKLVVTSTARAVVAISAASIMLFATGGTATAAAAPVSQPSGSSLVQVAELSSGSVANDVGILAQYELWGHFTILGACIATGQIGKANKLFKDWYCRVRGPFNYELWILPA